MLKFRSDAKPGALVGRLENLVTGEQRIFWTGGELLDSIARDLEASANQRPPRPTTDVTRIGTPPSKIPRIR